ncbi:hypothetical protein ACOME3_001576 [Neoechinorhynchus agilis]
MLLFPVVPLAESNTPARAQQQPCFHNNNNNLVSTTQCLERRLAAHLESLMETISSRIDKALNPLATAGPQRSKRSRKTSPFPIKCDPVEDVEMSQEALLIQDIVKEQSQDREVELWRAPEHP